MIALLLLLLPAFAEDAWLVAETPSVRFADTATAGPLFAANDKVEVLARDGDRARVVEGDRYGWVPAASLTAVAPEGADPGLSSEEFQRLFESIKMNPK